MGSNARGPTRNELFQARPASCCAEATAFMRALRLMGLGSTELGSEEGDAVLTVADATSARLEIVTGHQTVACSTARYPSGAAVNWKPSGARLSGMAGTSRAITSVEICAHAR